jgi:hypothetical protein
MIIRPQKRENNTLISIRDDEPNDLLYPPYAARLPPPGLDDGLFIFH